METTLVTSGKLGPFEILVLTEDDLGETLYCLEIILEGKKIWPTERFNSKSYDLQHVLRRAASLAYCSLDTWRQQVLRAEAQL